MRPLVELFAALDGAELPGGCDGCNAVQRVRDAGGGVFVLDVFHSDDDCPTLARRIRHRRPGWVAQPGWLARPARG
jgi:hypothetical protein